MVAIDEHVPIRLLYMREHMTCTLSQSQPLAPCTFVEVIGVQNTKTCEVILHD